MLAFDDLIKLKVFKEWPLQKLWKLKKTFDRLYPVVRCGAVVTSRVQVTSHDANVACQDVA